MKHWGNLEGRGVCVCVCVCGGGGVCVFKLAMPGCLNAYIPRIL